MNAGAARTILAFDYGLRRIGVAIGNTLTRTASPLRTFQARDGLPDWAALAALLREYSPGLCVVGIPYNMDGSETSLTPRAREFATRVGELAGTEVALVDERLSSRAAEELLRERRATGRLRRRVQSDDVDRVAATVLLLQWLHDSPSRDGHRPTESTSDLGDGE